MAWGVSRYRKLKWLSIAVTGVWLTATALTVHTVYCYGFGRMGLDFGKSALVIGINERERPFGQGLRRLGPSKYDYWSWLPEVLHDTWNDGTWFSCVVIPLWMPPFAGAVSAVFFHRKARGPIPGHCVKFGYNLAGNTSGVCRSAGRKDDPQVHHRDPFVCCTMALRGMGKKLHLAQGMEC